MMLYPAAEELEGFNLSRLRPPQPVRYHWVDYGRFVAAVSVVFFHYFSNGVRNGNVGDGVTQFSIISPLADYGYLGVHFFFIVSGFVIWFSAVNRKIDQFAVSRAVRLYPAFIFCLAVTAAITHVTGFQEVNLIQILANATMMPTALGFDFIDGVYWTLELELKFYILAALAIGLRITRYPKLLVSSGVLSILALTLAGMAVPTFGMYASFFAAGAALSLWYQSSRSATNIAMVVVSGGLCVFEVYRQAVHRADLFPNFSPTVAATICVIFFIAFISLRKHEVRNPRLAKAAGVLTYPLYLLHAYIGYSILSAWQNDQNKWIVTAAIILAMLLAALFVHILIEHLPRSFWRKVADKTIGAALRALSDASRSLVHAWR